jgi:hypothetical protein
MAGAPRAAQCKLDLRDESKGASNGWVDQLVSRLTPHPVCRTFLLALSQTTYMAAQAAALAFFTSSLDT